MFDLIPYVNRNMRGAFYDFDRMFSNSFRGLGQTMRADITDTGESYKLQADLPGFGKDDIKIDITEDCMTISAERKSETEEGKEGYVRRERVYGSFTRRYDISGIDAEGISANYTDGVLTLDLPKKAELKPETRQILIQ